MTCVTIYLNCTEMEGKGMYDTPLPNWGGTNSEHSIG